MRFGKSSLKGSSIGSAIDREAVIKRLNRGFAPTGGERPASRKPLIIRVHGVLEWKWAPSRLAQAFQFFFNSNSACNGSRLYAHESCLQR